MTDDPIEPEYRERMNALAEALDVLFNEPGKQKRTGFALLMFDFDRPRGSSRVNYISNARREDMIEAIGEWMARQHGRKQ